MSKKFKAPNSDPDFVKYWDLFVGDVVARENFKNGHLEQLAILCRLYMEFYTVSKILDEKGLVYETESERYGNQVKVNPASTIRDKTLMEIRQYSKLLGLILEKDSEKKEEPKVKSEWS